MPAPTGRQLPPKTVARKPAPASPTAQQSTQAKPPGSRFAHLAKAKWPRSTTSSAAQTSHIDLANQVLASMALVRGK